MPPKIDVSPLIGTTQAPSGPASSAKFPSAISLTRPAAALHTPAQRQAVESIVGASEPPVSPARERDIIERWHPRHWTPSATHRLAQCQEGLYVTPPAASLTLGLTPYLLSIHYEH